MNPAESLLRNVLCPTDARYCNHIVVRTEPVLVTHTNAPRDPTDVTEFLARMGVVWIPGTYAEQSLTAQLVGRSGV